MPSPAMSWLDRPVRSVPSHDTFPAFGCRNPQMTRTRVDFPEPFGPMTEVICFRSASMETFCRMSISST